MERFLAYCAWCGGVAVVDVGATRREVVSRVQWCNFFLALHRNCVQSFGSWYNNILSIFLYACSSPSISAAYFSYTVGLLSTPT